MKCCKTCKQWNTYGSYLGECEKLLNCYLISIKVEPTIEYGPHGEEYIDHPVKKIDTNEDFLCNQWESE